MYYRLYITYTLSGFLFDLDQSNICRDIQKIEGLIRKCANSSENILLNKEAKNSRGSREIFSRICGFIDSTEQQIPALLHDSKIG